jgi:hypothetical protein
VIVNGPGGVLGQNVQKVVVVANKAVHERIMGDVVRGQTIAILKQDFVILICVVVEELVIVEIREKLV